MRLMFIADITGRPGRWVVSQLLWGFKRKHEIDFVIANVENAAGGYGITREMSQKLFAYGVDVQSSGNHIFDRPDAKDMLNEEPYVLRPANYPPAAAGKGSVWKDSASGVTVGVLNVQGRVFMKEIDCPFRTADKEVERLREKTPIIFVDFHAEATSEKQALAYYLDGRVSAVVGTHTHVQTADEKILAGGTAYLSDAGMTGPHDAVLWTKPEIAIARFLTGMPHKFEMAEGDIRMCGCVVEVDDRSGRAISIERYQCAYDGVQPVREYFGLPERQIGEAEPRSLSPNDV